MITSSENKYKDRTPLETVEIIHNFFTDYLGLEIERERDIESESGTWWCHLKLHLPENNIVICTSNGKGATHDFSLASGSLVDIPYSVSCSFEIILPFSSDTPLSFFDFLA